MLFPLVRRRGDRPFPALSFAALVLLASLCCAACGDDDSGGTVAILGSAVELELDSVAAAAVSLNGTDISDRPRGDGPTRTLLLAGVPGADNPLRYGHNELRLGDGSRRVFTWNPARVEVRLIVIGNRLDFAAYQTFATWQDEVNRIFATYVVPQLTDDRPTLVLLTEDFGLPAALIGSRGASTRAARDADPLTALSNLFVEYAPQVAFYLGEYDLPGSDLQPAARALELALTDTLWRAFGPVLAAKAAQLGVFVAACTNVAEVERSTDPAAVAMFGDVDNPLRDDVFLPVGADVYNTAFLWGPDGALIGKTRKVFLTDPEIDLLNLSTGNLDDVAVFDTAIGRIGFAISKDAFIPEYVGRLSDLGATLVLQPDANPGIWATPADGRWEPDGWTVSVLGMLRGDLPNIAYNATSMMAGNFFPGTLTPAGVPDGIVFDGQSSITARSLEPPRDAFVAMADPADLPVFGYPLLGRFVALAPWTFPDPVTLADARALDALRERCHSDVAGGAEPAVLTLYERRALLHDCALTLLPGGANRDQYGESVVVADLEMPASR